jgi:hypothetical protein
LRDRLGALHPGALATSPETQVRTSLAARAAGTLPLAPGGEATLSRIVFADVTALAEGDEARAVAIADADGRVPVLGRDATLSYVGREALVLDRCGPGRWCPRGPLLPALAGVLAALVRRAEAFDRGDASAYADLVSDTWPGPGGKPAVLARLRADLAEGPRARLAVIAWQIRVERDRAEVGEDAEVSMGGGPPARVRGRYVLVRSGERWLVADGL